MSSPYNGDCTDPEQPLPDASTGNAYLPQDNTPPIDCNSAQPDTAPPTDNNPPVHVNFEEFGDRDYWLERLQKLDQLDDGTFQSRLEILQSAVETMQDSDVWFVSDLLIQLPHELILGEAGESFMLALLTPTDSEVSQTFAMYQHASLMTMPPPMPTFMPFYGTDMFSGPGQLYDPFRAALQQPEPFNIEPIAPPAPLPPEVPIAAAAPLAAMSAVAMPSTEETCPVCGQAVWTFSVADGSQKILGSHTSAATHKICPGSYKEV